MIGKMKTRRPPAFEPGTKVAVLGLGVSGEAAARLASARGGSVYASDVSAERGPVEAAARLQAEGISAEAGQHDVERILAADLIVVSPGIGPATEIRSRIVEAGIRTIGEVELAWRDLSSRVIAITGPNGKTTTTGLVAPVLATAGVAVTAAGPSGHALSDIAMRSPQPDWVALELSSFQLADQDTVSPDIGVLLNLSPDHLDRYRDVESYYADKGRLFDGAGPESRWVLNADDPRSLALAEGVDGQRFLFSTAGRVDLGAFLGADGALRAGTVAANLDQVLFARFCGES